VTLQEVVNIVNEIESDVKAILDVRSTVYDTVEANCKYAVYLERQEEEMAR
jgi:tRNA U34 5-carboxymethylaminomethyl modifying enzyme MnmG/GidA